MPEHTSSPTSQPAAAPPLIVLVGPTAVGKTGLSLALASRFGGEIVNADSRAFYRGMDIGTAKPTPAERTVVPHHLIDILDPVNDVSLATFQDLATAAILDITDRGKLPFLVGGTPQYVNALVEGWQIPRVAPDRELRQHLERLAEEHGVEHLIDRLAEVDPVSAERIGANVRRLIRAIEVYETSGKPISEQQGKGPPPFRALELELWLPREVLYPRIDARVDHQVAEGLLDEVRGLLDAGVPPDAPALSSIGYRQVLPYLTGQETAQEVSARIKHDTHRLVRHQQTWWRKNPRLHRLDMRDPDVVEAAMRTIAHHLGEPSGALQPRV
jgi:tRNA dimethylallyltransferase